MNISQTDLAAQYERANTAWPFLHQVAARHGLPPFFLHAVGSRETNLVDELGDGGHGHGVFQLDDRSHQIPDPFPVEVQAEIAAGMLAELRDRFGSWRAAANAYNSGQPLDEGTTGGDYGIDVWQRCAWLAGNFTVPQEVDPMGFPNAVDAVLTPDGTGTWTVATDGGVFTAGAAPFYGSYEMLPAAERQGSRRFLRIQALGPHTTDGYAIIADDGGAYRFDPDVARALGVKS